MRGGATDQNLILFNDGTVYNPTHLFGCLLYTSVATKKKRNGQKPVFKPVTDYWVNSLWRSLLKDGHYCSHNDIRAILMSDFSETFHPFRSYFEGLAPWRCV